MSYFCIVKGDEGDIGAKESKRLASVDALRGFTIAGMILVNNPGTWSAIYTPLEHAEWNGLTPTDLVFPFFMMIMGVSMCLSLTKRRSQPKSKVWVKVIRRTIVIYLIGIAVGWIAKFCYSLSGSMGSGLPLTERIATAADCLDRIRLMGVMPRLALSYFLGSVLVLTLRQRALPWIAGVILVGYSLILLLGNGYEFSEQNVICRVDTAILGHSHMYKGLTVGGVNIPFDPEGLLSTLPCVAHVIIGYLIGQMIVTTKKNSKRVVKLSLAATSMMGIGWLASYGLPINKNIWSPTFVLVTCGMATCLLALLIWVIDEKKHRSWCKPLIVFGVNPLFLYVVSGVLAILMGSIKVPFGEGVISIQRLIYQEGLLPLIGDATAASCTFAILFVAINWIIGYILYRNKIYIKI